ncbi:uncharacterized protein EV154DRAFT_487173 [Mucor mucedo]|uniref:uncharacterized protein n=1 Tax=Mucor mucedo TaxID=29922 RepID=UPI002220F5D7|nr:uncharacterized protein EV154DRAFT_487173 [Mucor mucedo]KAI7873483.1 hypothetical protein EV154DRAFT_487173 [Mucor mucedo]
MAESIMNQLNKMFDLLKRNYLDDHPAMIMECLETNNITLPIQDDEAGCSDENSDNDNESGAPQVNDASKTKEPEVVKKKVVLPDMEMLKNNIKSMATENRLMRIMIPILPNLNDRTKQSELEVYVRAVKDYYDNGITFGNWDQQYNTQDVTIFFA